LVLAQTKEKNGEIWQVSDDPRGERASTASVPDYSLPTFIEATHHKQFQKALKVSVRFVMLVFLLNGSKNKLELIFFKR